MDDDVYDEDENFSEKGDSEVEESDEEGFMEGYEEDEKVEECAECGIAIKEGKKVLREIEGEEYAFCSESCAKEFEESVKTE